MSGLVAQEPGLPAAPPVETYAVGRAQPPVSEGTEVVALGLAEAVERALDRNPSLRAARLGPELRELAVASARAAFGTTLNASYSYRSATSQSTSQLDGGPRLETTSQSLGTSLDRTLRWTGGSVGVQFDNSRTTTNSDFAVRNPSYASFLTLRLRQPLLAGLETDPARHALQAAEIQADVARLSLLEQVLAATTDVRRAYWALRSALEEVETRSREVAQAGWLLAADRSRVEAGRMAELEAVRSEAGLAEARKALVDAEVQWRNRELELKLLLVEGTGDPLFGATLNPTELPVLVERAPDLEAAVERALAGRLDLRRQREERRVAQLSLRLARSMARPDVALTASYSLQGVGGDLFDRSGLGGAPVLVEPGGWGGGLDDLVRFRAPTLAIGLEASYPLGLRAGRADARRAALEVEAADLALGAAELAVAAEVTRAGLGIRNTRLQVEAARESRAIAERSLEAARLRLEAGAGTTFDVQQAQDDLTRARIAELRAVIDHVNAVADFDRVLRAGR